MDLAVDVDRNDKPITMLQWDFSKASRLKFGHYTARLVMAYDNGMRDVPLEATVGFWVVPMRVIGAGLLILTLAGVGLWSIVRKIYKRMPNKKTKVNNDKTT